MPVGIETGVAAERRNFLQAIVLVCASVLCFSLLDTCAKLMVRELPPVQVVWARYFGHFVLACIMVGPWRSRNLMKTGHLKLQILRSVLLFVSTATNFFALQYLQLAETVSILFIAPLLVAMFSVLFLGEYVGPRRWAAIVVGFVGVLIITRPGGDAFQWPALLSLTGAVCVALYNIITRKIAGADDPWTSQFYVTLVACAALTPAVPTVWVEPSGPMIWGLLVAVGLLGGVGHWIFTIAHSFAPASHIAPFMYSQIVWMVALGYIVFDDLPGPWTAVGGTIVVASGLYLLKRQKAVAGG